MNLIAGGFLFFYLGVAVVFLLLCCILLQANNAWCASVCECRCFQNEFMMDKARIDEINEKIIVKKASSFGDFSLRKSRSRLAIMKGDGVSAVDTILNPQNSHDDSDVGVIVGGTDTGTSLNIISRDDDNEQGNTLRSSEPNPGSSKNRKCTICIEEYKIGDEICYSRNRRCPHFFHVDCMKNWLMNKNQCPLCRNDYLEASVWPPKNGDSETPEQI